MHIHSIQVFVVNIVLGLGTLGCNSASGSIDSDGGGMVDAGSGDIDYQDIALQSIITGVQPMTGIVLWEEHWNSDVVKTEAGNIQLEFAYISPDSIVNAAGEYDWVAFDTFLDRIAGRGHQAIVRFFYSYPGRETAVPQSIKNVSGYNETIGTSEGLPTSFPDWSNAELRQFHLDFYTAYAQRYDTDARIAFLQVGFGLWGEYHIYDGPNEVGQQFPSKNFQEIFLRHLNNVVLTTHWSLSIDAGDDYYSPFSNTQDLLEIPFGNFDDSFMHEEHSEYNASMWDFFGHDERHENSPHGGELSYYTQYDQEHALDIEGMHGRTYETLSSEFHISYMIGADQPSYQSAERIREAGMANGYKFEVIDFQASSNQAKVVVRNIGIAPIYYDAFVTVNGVRSAGSLKGLLPGEKKEYGIAAGGTEPSLTIESDRLVSGQEIQFQADL